MIVVCLLGLLAIVYLRRFIDFRGNQADLLYLLLSELEGEENDK